MAFFGICSMKSNPNAKDYFKDAAERLSHADYVVGNLETPFSIKKKTYGAKSAYICSNVANVELLKQLHIDAVTLANNHMFDYGKEGYETTKKVLIENGINFFGTEGKGLDVDMLGNSLRFEGFCCYSSNPLQAVPYGGYGVNEYEVRKVDEILEEQENNVRLCVTAVHAGMEHVNYPSLDHVKAARWLASRHRIIYYGHHPHVAQGIEKQKESLIAYSLGNFCFDDVWSSVNKEKPLVKLTENNRSSFMLELDIQHNEILGYNVIPIYIGKDKMQVGKGIALDNLHEYMSVVDNMDVNEYNTFRNDIINRRIRKRKSERNISWYFKRLRVRYIKLVFKAHKNAKNYARCINW